MTNLDTTYGLIATIFMSIIVATLIMRNIIAFKEKKNWNWSRTLIALCFMVSLILEFSRFLYYGFGIEIVEKWMVGGGEMAAPEESGSISNAFRTLIVVFGLMFCAYVNGKDDLLYIPVYIYVACIFLFIYSDLNGIFDIYVKVGGIIALFFFFEIAIRVKDDNTFGLGIYFVLLFADVLAPIEINGIRIIKIASLIMGLIYSTGKMRFFKKIESY